MAGSPLPPPHIQRESSGSGEGREVGQNTPEREREKNKEASTVEWIKKKVHASAESAERTPEWTAAFKRRRRRL